MKLRYVSDFFTEFDFYLPSDVLLVWVGLVFDTLLFKNFW